MERNISLVEVQRPPSQLKDAGDIKAEEPWPQESGGDPQGTTFFSQVKCPTSIEQVILAFKAEATRRLKPALLKSVKLKSQASPSVKQFLEIYDKPTAVDKFTGKPIPLRQVYNHEMVRRKRQGTTLAVMTKAMGNIARQTELRGNIYLARNDPYHNTLTEQDSFWTCDMPEQAREKTMAMSDLPAPMPSKQASPEFKTIKDQKEKWHSLPVYLTAKGEMRGPLLEKYGDKMMYCGPSEKIVARPPEIKKSSRGGRSLTDSCIFVTQTRSPMASRKGRPSSRSRPLSRARLSDAAMNEVGRLQLRGWEPLTKTALLEHTRVSELQVSKTTGTPQDTWNPHHARVTSSKAKSRLNSASGYKQYNGIGYSDASNHFYSKYSSLYSKFFGFPTKI